jgi:sigma-E factor negative regulatory protein RseC
MLEETATVMETGEGRARVMAERKSACGHCSANQTCGTSVLSKYIGKRSMGMWVTDPLGVQKGEQVVIRLQEGGLLLGSLAVYLLPLVLFIGAAMLGDSLAGNLGWGHEATAISFALLGLLVSYAWLRRLNRRIADNERFRPVIVERRASVSYIDMNSLGKLN